MTTLETCAQCPQQRGEGQGQGCECARIASQNALGLPLFRMARLYISSYIQMRRSGCNHRGAIRYARNRVAFAKWAAANVYHP